MAKPSQVIALLEDNRQQQFIHRYLRRIGLKPHAIRFVLPSSGSGEQWVRERFPTEAAAYRRRSLRAETKLIAVTDADNLSLPERLAQLDRGLAGAGLDPIRIDEQIARLIPRRNVETWILYLNAVAVDEEIDYKRTRNDWVQLTRPAAERLYAWTRPNTRLPDVCIPSLQHGIAELCRLDFSAA
jgi:hypothetical protein